jgi:hypothetical protein
LLVAVVAIMSIATADEILSVYHLRQRDRMDAAIFHRYVARARPADVFQRAQVLRPYFDLDISCASHVVGRSIDYRLCLLLRRSGLADRRVRGGYLRPPLGFDTKKFHWACFGLALTGRLCPHNRTTPLRRFQLGRV